MHLVVVFVCLGHELGGKIFSCSPMLKKEINKSLSPVRSEKNPQKCNKPTKPTKSSQNKQTNKHPQT